MYLIGIRREDKNLFERRVPLVPADVADLGQRHGVKVTLQPSSRRVFSDEEYLSAGAAVVEGLEACPIILGVKEIPPERLSSCKTYLFFSHTIKGQAHNMPLLRRLLELGCTLIDYEKIVDETGRRLVFFGRHAGLAGMIDTLWALGQRLSLEGLQTPFARLMPAHRYGSLDEAKLEIARVGEDLRRAGLPAALRPLTFGVTGYGNVSLGAQEILDLLQPCSVEPAELSHLPHADPAIYKAVFREEHLAEPAPGRPFDLQDYYQRPEEYRPVFARYLAHLSVIVNCIYWEARYPRLVTIDALRQLYAGPLPRLRVIGDISCDVDGSIEATVRATDPDHPVYVYDLESGQARDGFEGAGPVILAVENLPAELPREASLDFSTALRSFIFRLAAADFTAPLDQAGLPDPLRRAVIAYRGELTPSFAYLARCL
jgi:alpha-aminoadipic semialdehyde synthase